MIRLAILGSTRGSNLDALVEAIAKKELPASIELVLSNKETAQILPRATTFGLKTVFVDPKSLSREDYDHQLSKILQEQDIELIVLIGYMRILSSQFVSDWQAKIINVHPSLLPAHAGLMDLEVHQAVIDAKEKESGCSVHFVTEDLDAGPIILQKTCKVLPNDNAEKLKARVQALEGEALIEAIKKIIEKRFS